MNRWLEKIPNWLGDIRCLLYAQHVKIYDKKYIYFQCRLLLYFVFIREIELISDGVMFILWAKTTLRIFFARLFILYIGWTEQSLETRYSLIRNRRFMLDEITYQIKTLFLYFWNTKIRVVLFVFSFHTILFFPRINALLYVDLDQDIKLSSTKWRRKKLPGFSYSKNRANFEAFRSAISSSINLLFLKSEILCVRIFKRRYGGLVNFCDMNTTYLFSKHNKNLKIRLSLISHYIDFQILKNYFSLVFL